MIDNNTTGSIAEALAKAQGEFPAIPKNRTAKVPMKAGGTYSYDYADLSDIVQAVRPVLAKHGLSFSQSVAGQVLRSTLFHSSGQMISSEIPFNCPPGGRPQDTGSALTYARRYCLCALLGVVAEEDDDGNIAQGSGTSAPKAAAARGSVSNAPSAVVRATTPKAYTKADDEKARKLGFDNAEKHSKMVQFLWIRVKEANLTKEDIEDWCKKNTNPVKGSTKDLNWAEANNLKKDLEHRVRMNAKPAVGSPEDIAAAAMEPGSNG